MSRLLLHDLAPWVSPSNVMLQVTMIHIQQHILTTSPEIPTALLAVSPCCHNHAGAA